MNEYQRKLVEALRALNVQDPPAPWHYVNFVLVGGVESIGYREASDLLLVVSPSGRSVIDLQTGDKVARDRTETTGPWYHPIQLLADGIGPLTGQEIHLAGIYGGGFPTVAQDGWYLELVAPDWPNSFVLMHAPIVFEQGKRLPERKFKVAPRHDLGDVVLTYGFSPLGSSFVVAYSHGIDVYARAAFSDLQ